MNILWIINFDYPTRLHHGSTLRHVNYARELQARGHRVYFGVGLDPSWREESRQWFAELRRNGVISGILELQYVPSLWDRRMYKISMLPSLGNRFLRRAQADATRVVTHFMSSIDAGAVIVSDRQFWFLADEVTQNPWSIQPLSVGQKYSRPVRTLGYRELSYRRFMSHGPLISSWSVRNRWIPLGPVANRREEWPR